MPERRRAFEIRAGLHEIRGRFIHEAMPQAKIGIAGRLRLDVEMPSGKKNGRLAQHIQRVPPRSGQLSSGDDGIRRGRGRRLQSTVRSAQAACAQHRLAHHREKRRLCRRHTPQSPRRRAACRRFVAARRERRGRESEIITEGDLPALAIDIAECVRCGVGKQQAVVKVSCTRYREEKMCGNNPGRRLLHHEYCRVPDILGSRRPSLSRQSDRGRPRQRQRGLRGCQQQQGTAFPLCKARPTSSWQPRTSRYRQPSCNGPPKVGRWFLQNDAESRCDGIANAVDQTPLAKSRIVAERFAFLRAKH